MNSLLNSKLMFVVLGESGVILILLAIILYQCVSVRRLRRKMGEEKGGKGASPEDLFRPPSGMRLLNYSPAPRSYRWEGESLQTGTTAVYDRDTKFTAATSASYNSLHPPNTKPGDLSDTPDVVCTPTQTFSTYEAFYRAQSLSASSPSPDPASPPSSTILLPPPSPAYLKTHETSRLATSTLRDEHKEDEERRAVTDRGGNEVVETRAGVVDLPPITISEAETAGEGSKTVLGSRKASYRALRPFPDLQTTPPSTPRRRPSEPALADRSPPASPPRPVYASPRVGRFREGDSVPASPPAARRGMRSRSASRSIRPQELSLSASPPRGQLLRGLSDSADLARHEDVRVGGPSANADGRGQAGRMPRSAKSFDGDLRRAGGPSRAEARTGGRSQLLAARDSDTSQPSSYFDD